MTTHATTLDNLMSWIKQADQSGKHTGLPEIEHHSIHLTRFLIEDKLNIKLTLEQVKQIMYEEGLLPDEYYFSAAYIRKYKATKAK